MAETKSEWPALDELLAARDLILNAEHKPQARIVSWKEGMVIQAMRAEGKLDYYGFPRDADEAQEFLSRLNSTTKIT